MEEYRRRSVMTPLYSVGSERWPGAAKLLEEATELAAVLAKLLASPDGQTSWSGEDLPSRIAEEWADVRAAMDYFVVENRHLLQVDTLWDRVGRKWQEIMKAHDDERGIG